ncbi:MAG: hypothetical protein OJF52_002857 [Nitrospira sp.]|nr:MAG: hypothetical protein OJF52_002857 [Nitrospira sp.]
MWEHVRHEKYKGYNFRSSPREVTNGWKIRIHIPFTMGGDGGTIREHLREELYSTLDDAHTAGINWGRELIDSTFLKRK